MGPAQGSGSCQCASSFSLILRSAMVSSAGAGFSFFSSSMRSDPRAFLRVAALAAPSRRVGRVFSFEFLVSSWEPSSGSRGWVPAPYRVRGRLSAGTTGESPSPQPSPVEGEGVWEPGSGRTRGSAPTTGESPSPQPSPVEGEGVWEPGSGRTRGSAPTTGESPSSQPSPVEGEGVWEPGSGRTRGSAPTTGESPSPQPSPVVEGEGVWEPGSGRTRGSAPTAGVSPSPQPSPVEGEGVWEGCSSRTMCTMSSLAAAILWWVLKPSVLSCMTSSRKSMMVTPSAVWARMSLAMRNSSIPERTGMGSRLHGNDGGGGGDGSRLHGNDGLGAGDGFPSSRERPG